ncbi:Transmembrane protein TauE like [Macleaya cordata]|uniref:Transmembrane protein TauE like n=1 Tax=Macleaya cordata TaxID=56857 RepID=A0A200PP23_MACCD|nr:Transmembrane protein TauE like [Macleaya cordata]
MAEYRARWQVLTIVVITFFIVSGFVSAERNLKLQTSSSSSRFNRTQEVLESTDYYFLHAMKFGWRIIVGTIMGFIGAAFGSVGGVGGGGIYVPMLTLVIGFDAKTSVPISKCMIMGAAVSTVYYNIKRRHPTLDMPIIDYNLTLLIQPMLMLGISIGVILSEILANWMVTILLIVLFLGTSSMSFFKGVETWKKETILKKVTNPYILSFSVVPILENVYWKELGLLIFVWVAFLVLQIFKNNRATCSTSYWVLSSMQIPVSVGVTLYEAIGLYKGMKVIASMGEAGTNWKIHQLIFYSFVGVLAGVVGGLLGMGGGFILGPLFLELGIPPQVSSATATFAMTFSSSMSVIEYYLLKRFPVPYALYFLAVATLAALVGQHVVRKMILILGRASLIIFILALTIFLSAILLGGVGIADMIKQIEHKEYLGFEKLCR